MPWRDKSAQIPELFPRSREPPFRSVSEWRLEEMPFGVPNESACDGASVNSAAEAMSFITC